MATKSPGKSPRPQAIKPVRRDTIAPRDIAIQSEAEKRNLSKRRFAYDLIGVGMIAFSFIILGSLIAPSKVITGQKGENFFGLLVVDYLRLVMGVGAWIFPFILFISGVMLAVGRRRSLDNVGGAFMVWFVLITWLHLGNTTQKNNFDEFQLKQFGGWIGAGICWCLRTSIGNFGGHVMLFALMVVAIMWLCQISLHSVVVPLEWAIANGSLFSRSMFGGAQNEWARRRNGERERRESPEPEESEPDTPLNMPLDDPNATRKMKPQTGKTRTMPNFFGKKPNTPVAKSENAPLRRTPIQTVAKFDADSDNPAASVPRPTKEGWILPPFALLKAPSRIERTQTERDVARERTLIKTLEDFNIGADIDNVVHGPAITRYEIKLDSGIKVSKIVSLADNLAMSLAAMDVRIEAPIPGKSAIGIEVPNENPITVTLREVIEEKEFQNAPSILTIALGKDVEGKPRYADLTKMPHLLIGGTTGSGKSVCLNTIVCSLLYRATPDDVKFLMIDPKKVELSMYEGIPHLVAPVITDVKQAPIIFKKALQEMESRYDLFAKAGTRNIEGYNNKAAKGEKLPYWVLIVDELADLMMQSGPEIEAGICRLAQLSRATGIHLIIATQRPSVNVITGTIKANISSRIAFAVNALVDSRTILDMSGAERLIGRGDMLFMPLDAAKPQRIQGCFVSENETQDIVGYWKSQGDVEYDLKPSAIVTEVHEAETNAGNGTQSGDDDLFEQAVRLVVSGGTVSTSLLQRRFKIGYGRAARLIDTMQDRGIVGAMDSSNKGREVLLSRDAVEAMFAGSKKP